MINILTLHYATTAWLEIQKRYISKYTDSSQYKLWLGRYNIEIPKNFTIAENWEYIDLDKKYPKDGANEHYLQMQWMYKNVLKDTMDDDDILVFLDSDAFPCAVNWAPSLENALKGNDGHEKIDVACLHQIENRGIAQPDEYYPYPDLCFFATTKKVWEENNLEWGMFKPGHQNPGFGMLDRITEAKLKEGSIQRTNRFNANNVMFGVYGDVIYHQACGSRAIIGRPKSTARAGVNKSRQCYTGQDLYGRSEIGNWVFQEFENACSDIIDVNTKIFDVVYEKLLEDKDATFVRRYFLGQP